MRIGFIGIGVMGSAIVKHLLANDYEVTGYTRTKAKVETLIQQGMHWADTIQGVVQTSDVIFTMVGFPEDLVDVYLDMNKGAFAVATNGQIFIDLTTSKPSLAKTLAEKAREHGAFMLEAPVSGGDIGAIQGTLMMMVGGDADIFEQVKPILTLFTNKIIHFGLAGSGQHVKMANQIAVATNVLGMAESLIYAQKAGLDPTTVLSVIGNGAAGSWQLLNNGPKALAHDYSPGFYVKHFVKDLRIAVEEATTMGINLPNLHLAEQLFTTLLEQGDGDLGTQAIYKLYL